MEFIKAVASGNDFILIDNRNQKIKNPGNIAVSLCRRKFSVGADGLIVLEKGERLPFKFRIFNPDGSEAEMCGNGARCFVLFLKKLGLIKDRVKFETLAGIVEATCRGNLVKVSLPPLSGLKLDFNIENFDRKLCFVNSGVPHAVIFTEDLENEKITETGKFIRFHSFFAPAGTNVDFVQIKGPARIDIRTYERGVEDETLACGTGAVASAYIAYKKGLVRNPVEVKTKSGEILKIDFSEGGPYLEGEARLIFKGEIL